MNDVERPRVIRLRTAAVVLAAVAVASVAVSAAAFGSSATGPSVTLCVNAQRSVRVPGEQGGCAAGERAVQVYSKAGADARFATRTTVTALNVYESESSCIRATNGTGAGAVTAEKCHLFSDSGLTQSAGSDVESLVTPIRSTRPSWSQSIAANASASPSGRVPRS